jgi:hypothetical protein
VAAHVILFAVMRGGGAMRVSRQFVKFGSATVVSVWHDRLLVLKRLLADSFSHGVGRRKPRFSAALRSQARNTAFTWNLGR